MLFQSQPLPHPLLRPLQFEESKSSFLSLIKAFTGRDFSSLLTKQALILSSYTFNVKITSSRMIVSRSSNFSIQVVITSNLHEIELRRWAEPFASLITSQRLLSSFITQQSFPKKSRNKSSSSTKRFFVISLKRLYTSFANLCHTSAFKVFHVCLFVFSTSSSRVTASKIVLNKIDITCRSFFLATFSVLMESHSSSPSGCRCIHNPHT